MWTKLAVAAALVVGALAYWWLSRALQRHVLRRRRVRGRRGEVEASRLLTDAGYEILEDQASREVALQVDGAPRSYVLRPDFLVRRRGREYVVEVKTGKKAPDPLYAATRRQLLEYAVCFPERELLLVDMEAGQIHRVGWEHLASGRSPAERSRLIWLLAGSFGLGLGAGLLLALL